MKIYFGYREKT